MGNKQCIYLTVCSPPHENRPSVARVDCVSRPYVEWRVTDDGGGAKRSRQSIGNTRRQPAPGLSAEYRFVRSFTVFIIPSFHFGSNDSRRSVSARKSSSLPKYYAGTHNNAAKLSVINGTENNKIHIIKTVGCRRRFNR